MPIAASAALRAAVHDALIADAGLVSVLGGPRVYDEAPRGALFPMSRLASHASPIFQREANPRKNIS
jgi:hypothetical protein